MMFTNVKLKIHYFITNSKAIATVQSSRLDFALLGLLSWMLKFLVRFRCLLLEFHETVFSLEPCKTSAFDKSAHCSSFVSLFVSGRIRSLDTELM